MALPIYFIAHVVHLVQSSTIVSSAYQDTMKTIAGLDVLDDSSPEARATEAKAPNQRPELTGLFTGNPLVVQARKSSYLQYLNVDAVVDAVVGGTGGKRMAAVKVPFNPGKFVAAGLPIVRVWPTRELDHEAEDEVHAAFYFGKEHSFRQDFAFGLRQLSDIALKGLSPTFNDSTTAMQAMDRTEATFIALGKKTLPPRVREEASDGMEVLVKVGYYGFEDAVGLAFDQIRRSAFTGGQVAVLERLLQILEHAIRANHLPERRRSLWLRPSA